MHPKYKIIQTQLIYFEQKLNQMEEIASEDDCNMEILKMTESSDGLLYTILIKLTKKEY